MLAVTAITSIGCFHILELEINFNCCWIYTGKAYWKNGYPIIRRHGKNWICSRFVWYFLTGRDYHGKEIHHKCENKACVNPIHLIELTSRKHRIYHNKI
jgi:hypothetical protein